MDWLMDRAHQWLLMASMTTTWSYNKRALMTLILDYSLQIQLMFYIQAEVRGLRRDWNWRRSKAAMFPAFEVYLG